MFIRKWNKFKDVVYRNTDFFLSLNISLLVLVVVFLFKIKLLESHRLFASLFLAIFIANLTVFALSKFLTDNYSKIESKNTKKNIDLIFRVPVKISVIGVILSVILEIFFINFTIYFIMLELFLLIYSLISSYYVFDFIYNISMNPKIK